MDKLPLKLVVVATFLRTMLICAQRGQNTVSSCLYPPTQTTNEPDRPSLPNSYRVRVEVSVAGCNLTLQSEEVVDNAGNRAVLITMDRGQQLKLIYNYDLQQVFYVTGDNCTVHNLTSDRARFIFFGQSLVDNRAHLLDGASSMFFGATIPKIYMGTSVIRGMWCDCWEACLIWPESSKNFTIKYFFTVKDWSTPSLFSQMPVRYDVNGTEIDSSGTFRSFHRIYDFFDFLPDVNSDPTLFQTGEGVVCSGRITTHPMPPLTSHYYHFREEVIDVYQGLISQADVWYDLDSKLVRIDYRSPDKTSPLDTTSPISEIHDFNYGTRFVKDLLSGECTPMALVQETFDSKLNTDAFRINNSFVMSLKNPLSFFFLDSNFSYVGQQTERDALCDVFISHRYDLDLHNNGSAYEATVETYFLAEGWADVANDELTHFSQQFPFRIHLWIPKMNYNLVYNLYDFSMERPDISVFDVSDCFNDSASLHFRIRFPGPYSRETEHMVKVMGQNALASSMKVSPLRVSRINVDNDATYLYLSAYLLDRTPSLVQFTHLPKAVAELLDDASWANVDSASSCSDLCVNSPDIVCLSFLYCPADRSACRISRQHTSEGQRTVVNGTCDLYARTVDMPARSELTIRQAFNSLQQGIQQNKLSFNILLNNEEEIPYVAVDAEILFGQLSDPVPRPSLTSQFSCRLEIVCTRHNLVNTYDLWYDSLSKLIRVDRRDATAGPPYYSPFTITTIHDFNKGVAYNIDRQRGNCSVTPIPVDNFNGFHQPVNLTLVNITGIEILTLKNPEQMFYLDPTYVFTGQKTVRGILCNVFESKRSDFSIGSTSEHSIFQYYFQAKNWEYEADSHEDITLQEPIQLNILDFERNEFIIVNFYDFNDESTAFDLYNIASCFTDDQKIEFWLQFNQTYHTYLETQEWQFRQGLQLALSQGAKVSQLRIQNMQVTYNRDTTFVIATLLGEVLSINHFIETGLTSPYTASVMVSQQDVEGCAASCYYGRQLICNSFDLCPDQTCYLSTLHNPDGNVTDPKVSCRHFSRLVNGTEPEAQLEDAFTTIKDLVYKRLLHVPIHGPDGSQIGDFLATGVRDDLLLTRPVDSDVNLNSKFHLYRTGAQMSGTILQQTGLAVDECATACLSQLSFICDTFTYCYTTANCFLNTDRPDNNISLVTSNIFCDIFTRFYMDSYSQYPGLVFESRADSTIQVSSAEDCARQCAYTTALTCRSFDLCSNGICDLHRQHILDLNTPVNNSTECSHYSRSYLADFTVNRQRIATGLDATIVDGVTPAVCAFRCSAQAGCELFEFCQGQCRLLTVVRTSSSTIYSANCDLYSFTATGKAVDHGTTFAATVSTNTATTSAQLPGSVQKVVSATVWTTSAVTQSYTPSQTTGCVEEPTGNSGSSETGVRIGIGMGAAVSGLMVGIGLVLIAQRVMARQQNDQSMELLP